MVFTGPDSFILYTQAVWHKFSHLKKKLGRICYLKDGHCFTCALSILPWQERPNSYDGVNVGDHDIPAPERRWLVLKAEI